MIYHPSILQAVHDLYDRLSGDPSYGVAAPGYSAQKIAFAVVLTPEGALLDISDEREKKILEPPKGKEKSRLKPKTSIVLKTCIVPGQAKPSGSGINPGFLWDNTKYLLGYDPKNENPERTMMVFEALKQHHLALEQEIDDPAFSSVCHFLKQWSPEDAENDTLLAEMSTGFGTFRIQGETRYVYDRPKIRGWWSNQQKTLKKEASGQQGMCLILGQTQVSLARLHEPKIKGVRGTQGAGAPLVSFNGDAFTSYGKKQSYNAPVSETATLRYCTALNTLLDNSQRERHHLSLADDTVVFWTEKETQAEAAFAALFSGKEETEVQDITTLEYLKHLFQALREGSGTLSTLEDDPDTPFYMLGLSPNVGRVSVRFWHTSTLGKFVEQLRAHYKALDIVRPPKGKEFPPAWMLLRETNRDGKDISPLLGGAMMRAILTGGPYPNALAAAIIRRIRADQDDKQHPNRKINYLRVAILKAWLTRLPQWQGEISVSLDPTRTDPAYRLGRLFSALEKTQEEALPGINATIRDRYYGAVSAAPGSVVPRLLRTYQHHLAKLYPGAKVNRERLVQEIMSGLDHIPKTLSLEGQSLFAIGYYHQRQDFFIRKSDDKSTSHSDAS